MSVVKETRKVADFNAVALRGYGDLEIEQQRGTAGQESLSIEADPEIMPKILAEVRDRRLVLGFSMPWYEWIWWWWQWLFTADKQIRFRLVSSGVESIALTGAGRVSGERLESDRLVLRVSGAGKIRLAGVAAKSIETRLSGAGDVELSGSADRHEVRISGAGNVRASQLATRHTDVVISGAGDLAANVSDELTARISGAGNVSYQGNPRVTQHVSGAGRVRQAR